MARLVKLKPPKAKKNSSSTGAYSEAYFQGIPVRTWAGVTVSWKFIMESLGTGFYAFPYFEIDGVPSEGTVEWIPAGGSHVWGPYQFTMPEHEVSVHAEGWCFINNEWIQDVVLDQVIGLETGEFTIDVIVHPSGAGYVVKEPDKTLYSYHEHVVLWFYANEGYELDYWRLDSWNQGTESSVELVIGEDTEVNVYFIEYQPPPTDGHIVDKWVNKEPDGNNLPMPVEVDADGKTFEVGVSYRNDSAVSFIGGCKVVVTKPDGTPVSPPVDWAGLSPGETLSVEYNISKVDQEGVWDIYISFLKQDGEELDSFDGVCLIAAGKSGKITKKWVNKSPEGNLLLIPCSVAADGNSFEVGVSYRNDSAVNIIGGCEVIVTKPDKTSVSPVIDWAEMEPGEELSHQYNIAKVDQEGVWNISIRFLDQEEGLELDRFAGVCLTAGEVPPIEYELIHEEIYEPEASQYKGKAEVCTMYFNGPPEQLPGVTEIVAAITEAVTENITANDGTMLKLSIYQGKGEWWDSKWKVEATIHSSPFPWAVVVPLIVALLIVIGLAYITHEVITTDWGKVISPFLIGGIAVAGVATVGIVAYSLSKRKKKF